MKFPHRYIQYFTYLLYFFLIVFTSFNIYLSSWYPLHGDISFNTDIARDFLLVENIADTHKLTLLGPRSGGIGGFFHGPLWIYLNVPAFMAGNGNPVVVGWFWVFLSVVSIIVTYIVATKLFNKTTGLLSALLLSIVSIDYTHALFNPFGAVILAPVFFYFYITFLKNLRMSDLVFALLAIGCSIQFQIAFAGPILFLFTLHVIYFLYRKRKLQYLLSYFVLLIPLSTYILFELRHQFLQTKAIISFVTSAHQDKITASVNHFQNRWDGIVNSLAMIAYPSQLLLLSIFAAGILAIWMIYKNKKSPYRYSYFVYGYLFGGYWIISFLFKGIVWGYYYWPFLPLTIIVFSSLFTIVDKRVALLIYAFVVYSGFWHYKNGLSSADGIIGRDTGSWKFNYEVAKNVFADAPNKFGYYVFSPDELGYSPVYAMHYVQRLHKEKIAEPFVKDTVTYLLMEPGLGSNPSDGGNWWKEHRVKIQQTSIKSKVFSNGFRIEKYVLSPDDIKIPSDPNIVHTLIFR